LLLNIHDHNRGLIRDAIEDLEINANSDNHTLKFHEVTKFRKKYPFAFYPLFRMQTQVQQNTLTEQWWNMHKVNQAEIREIERQKEIAKQERLKRESEQEEAGATVEVLKKRMGIRYYLMPWARAAEEKRLVRIAAIEKEMEEKNKRG
jgi:DNA polymerase III delta prime subunit